MVVAGRRKEALDETSAQGRATGADVTVVPTDERNLARSSPSSDARERFGRIDLLFNNAASVFRM